MDRQTVGAFFSELEKISSAGSKVGLGKRVVNRMANLGGLNEVAGLGVLAAPSADNMQAKYRARKAGHGEHADEKTLDKYRLIKEKYHDPVEVGGLGMLAAPYIGKRLSTGKWGH